MDFDQLRTFLEVAKQGSFSRAGQKVFRSQSAVSAQIRQIESEYGERLLDRSGKTVRLTPAGEVFREYAQRMLSLRDESLRAVADHGNDPRGVLALGANEATCLYVLPNVFAEYLRLYPSVQVSIYRNFSHKILERLDSGAIDVGIVTLPVKMPMLKVRTIFRDRLVLMVSADNPLAQHDKVPISMVVEQPLILPRTGFTRRIMDKLFRPYRDKLQVRMELPSIGMIKSFVAAGLGVSLISESFARDEVQSGKVKLIALKDNELSRELGLAYRRNRSLPRAAEVFIELLQRRTAQSGQKTATRTS
ncbi:MAG: LysR family transcriptional regulator [Acidobacteria bacterium]|jgi:DNA-binding transcriptional LysR family regulator|nr:MAG: LysR family transcriptional regulator [Acidobacteriota bacterium]